MLCKERILGNISDIANEKKIYESNFEKVQQIFFGGSFSIYYLKLNRKLTSSDDVNIKGVKQHN